VRPGPTVTNAGGPLAEGRFRGPGAGAPRHVRLLVSYLSIARYASSGQVQRLVTEGASTGAVRRRLERLADPRRRAGGGPLLRRLSYHRPDGRAVAVWALAPCGRILARDLVPGEPPHRQRDVGHRFLEHALLLNDVLLDLVHAAGVPPEPLAALPFRWCCEEGGALRFEMFHRALGIATGAALRPDALVTIPGRRRRLFIEAETGSQSIASRRPAHTGSALGKLERYAAFFQPGGPGAPSWYLRAFPDAFSPRLVFLVHSEERRRRVDEAVGEALRASPPAHFRAAVLTFAGAASAIGAYLAADHPRSHA